MSCLTVYLSKYVCFWHSLVNILKMNRIFLHVGNLHNFLDGIVNFTSWRGKVVLKLANENSGFWWIDGREWFISRRTLTRRCRCHGIQLGEYVPRRKKEAWQRATVRMGIWEKETNGVQFLDLNRHKALERFSTVRTFCYNANLRTISTCASKTKLDVFENCFIIIVRSAFLVTLSSTVCVVWFIEESVWFDWKKISSVYQNPCRTIRLG